MSGFFGSSKKKAKQKEEMETLRREKESFIKNEEESKEKIATMEDRIAELEADIRRLQMENAELRNKVHTEEPYEKIYNERQDLIEKHSEKTLRIKELENQEKTLNENIDSYLARKTKLEDENDTLIKELEKEKATVRELAEANEKLSCKIDEKEKQSVASEEDIERLNKLLDDMKKQNDDLDREIEETKQREKDIEETKQREKKQSMAYIEEMRKDLLEYKTKNETMLLESEALKSENESLFRANESKQEEIKEINKEIVDLKNELQREKLSQKKLQQEWDEEKKRTEFVLVSKTVKREDRQKRLEVFKEENDSEDDHVVSIVEAAKAERDALKQKERELKKRVSQLQTDKEELFRSGTSLFTENKTLKTKYDRILDERATLLQVEAALKRKVREQERELKDLKKTVDDLYYQNMSIQSKEESESKKNAYVVVMGNEMVKKLEREKSALHRRVKYLEKENSEIESRVIELERQSKELVDYSRKYDKTPSHVDSDERNRFPETDIDRNWKYTIDKPTASKAFSEYTVRSHTGSNRTAKSPDYFQRDEPPFYRSPSRQQSFRISSVRSRNSHDSRMMLPSISSERHSPRAKLKSPRINHSGRLTTVPNRP